MKKEYNDFKQVENSNLAKVTLMSRDHDRRKEFEEMFFEAISEISTTDDNTYLEVKGGREKVEDTNKRLLDRLDQDIREHKQEMRDRDKQILDDAREREQRYREEMVIQNKLFREEAKEREERMEKMISSLSSELKEIKQEANQTTKHVQSLVTTNNWGLVAAILAVAALVLTVIFTK